MTSIKTIEYYNEFAKEFTKSTWGQELDIPVEFNNRKRTKSGSFIAIVNSKEELLERKGQTKIELVTKKLQSHEDAIDVLKHELCHWYCYINHLDFKDGDKDFENELSRVGATSTKFGYLDKDKSNFIQGMTKNDKLNRNGFSDAKYKAITSQDMFDIIKHYRPYLIKSYTRAFAVKKAYEVYYKGQKLCYVFHFHGHWITIVENGKQDEYQYKTRKKALMPLIYQIESEPV